MCVGAGLQPAPTENNTNTPTINPYRPVTNPRAVFTTRAALGR